MDSLPSGIRYRHWPVDKAKACVLLAHGLAEHTGRYAHVAARFNERGVAVVGPDHVGHGASPGIRVFLRTFSEYLEPMLALRGLIEEWYPGQPVFLFGHSMGGLISAHLLLESQAAFRGAMLSGPAFHAVDPAPAPLLWIGRLLKKVLPKLGMVSLDANGVSRDPLLWPTTSLTRWSTTERLPPAWALRCWTPWRWRLLGRARSGFPPISRMAMRT